MILIIGAGLSGLTTAYYLKEAGIRLKIIEARGSIGGRIHTVHSANGTAIELGATWFQKHHVHLISLLETLGLGHFPQKTDSTVFYQQSAELPVQKVQIPKQAPSYRINGGTSTLIHQLAAKLDSDSIFLHQPVSSIRIHENSVQITAKDSFEGTSVVLALPPRLWANKIGFEPALPNGLIEIAKKTHTWMEDSIKVGLSYDTPFWQQQQIPSTLFSTSGPITELYDHSNAENSKFALCGFMNPSLKILTSTERQQLVVQQLRAVFGEIALKFTNYRECVWGTEEHTALRSTEYIFPHQNNGNPIFREALFSDTVLISGSESAADFPGYMDGAVQAGRTTAQKLIETHQNA